MFFDFPTKAPVLIILYACFYLNSMICVDKPKESLKTQFFCQLSEFHSTENVSFSPLPTFIHGTEICPILVH